MLTAGLKDSRQGRWWRRQGSHPKSREAARPSRRAPGPGPCAPAARRGGCCAGPAPRGPRRPEKACPEAPWPPLHAPLARQGSEMVPRTSAPQLNLGTSVPGRCGSGGRGLPRGWVTGWARARAPRPGAPGAPLASGLLRLAEDHVRAEGVPLRRLHPGRRPRRAPPGLQGAPLRRGQGPLGRGPLGLCARSRSRWRRAAPAVSVRRRGPAGPGRLLLGLPSGIVIGYGAPEVDMMPQNLTA